MHAAVKGHADAVQALLDAGADRYAEVRDHANLMIIAREIILTNSAEVSKHAS